MNPRPNQRQYPRRAAFIIAKYTFRGGRRKFRGYGQKTPTSGDAIAPVEGKLLEHMVAGNLTRNKGIIVAEYLEVQKCDGSPREFRSVLEHLDFPRNVLEAVPNEKTRNNLRSALTEIRRSLTA